eukprot:30241-Rhodomonas_salina.3
MGAGADAFRFPSPSLGAERLGRGAPRWVCGISACGIHTPYAISVLVQAEAHEGLRGGADPLPAKIE